LYIYARVYDSVCVCVCARARARVRVCVSRSTEMFHLFSFIGLTCFCARNPFYL